jgi:hypothetical protein
MTRALAPREAVGDAVQSTTSHMNAEMFFSSSIVSPKNQILKKGKEIRAKETFIKYK